MKNIHLLPTDKPSRVYLIKSNDRLGITSDNPEFTENFGSGTQNQHIYITSDEEIKEGDYGINGYNEVVKFVSKIESEVTCIRISDNSKITGGFLPEKIILTTDQDLIKEGIQAIEDEFLEWFVKNPNCEEIEVVNEIESYKSNRSEKWIYEYKITIPKEEPDYTALLQPVGTKQETLEEVAESFFDKMAKEKGFENWTQIIVQQEWEFIESFPIEFVKWQQEQCKKDLDAHLDVAEDLWLQVVKQNKKLYSDKEVKHLMTLAFEQGFKKADVVEAGLEAKETDIEVNWIFLKHKK